MSAPVLLTYARIRAQRRAVFERFILATAPTILGSARAVVEDAEQCRRALWGKTGIVGPFKIRGKAKL